MTNPNYEYLSHPADIRFRTSGNTLEEAFEQAAHAMFGVIIDTSTIRPERSVDIMLESHELDDLLYDYLSELLYLFEVEEIIFAQFHVDAIDKTPAGYSLTGQAQGESMDLDRHRFDTEVKAVTYHELSVTKEDQGYSTHVILDI